MTVCILDRQWDNDVNKFYKDPPLPEGAQPQFELKPKTEAPAAVKLPEGNLYKRDEARFFGEKQDDRGSSRGSVYQRNAAHFFGDRTPACGDRPFEPPPPEPKQEPAPKPILAQRRVLIDGEQK